MTCLAPGDPLVPIRLGSFTVERVLISICVASFVITRLLHRLLHKCDVGFLSQFQLPEVVLIKDEDSDTEGSVGDGE